MALFALVLFHRRHARGRSSETLRLTKPDAEQAAHGTGGACGAYSSDPDEADKDAKLGCYESGEEGMMATTLRVGITPSTRSLMKA